MGVVIESVQESIKYTKPQLSGQRTKREAQRNQKILGRPWREKRLEKRSHKLAYEFRLISKLCRSHLQHQTKDPENWPPDGSHVQICNSTADFENRTDDGATLTQGLLELVA